MIHKFDAIVSLRPNSSFEIPESGEIVWLDSQNPQPTDEEIQNEIARLSLVLPLNACKEKAKQLIAATDWSTLSDVGLANQSEFIAYRAALRALIINPVADPVFPTEPTPVWS